MDIKGRADHIEDYLVNVRTGFWFGWSDSKNKIYENLIVHDGGTKPTEKECKDGLAALQAAWDLENDSYKSERRSSYPSIQEQLDMQYWDSVKGTTTWKDAITKVKTDNPKPS
jgi:hypothetical protein|tara:strand:- start:378 stop:716 length:339 start_codon:yes stop_codon:yes gene_type:complete